VTGKQALAALAKARDLQRRALNNYAKVLRAKSHGKTAREAMERYERMSEEADRLLDQVAQHLED
jgi:hypothetical protein